MEIRLDPSDLDQWAEHWLTETRQPGCAIAIVQDGMVRHVRGYGVANRRDDAPMTADTAFAIASMSKAINAAVIAGLVEENVLSWDRPIRDYLPRAMFADPAAQAHVTLRDLVTMRTGLPRHDWSWLEMDVSRADLMGSLARLAPSAGFREKFQYNNLTVTLAGHISETVTGVPWEALVQTRIFDPLGMSDSGFGRPDIGTGACSYHENEHRILVETSYHPSPATAPSGGSIWSTAADMARWAAFNLGDSASHGKRIVSRDSLAELHTPQVIVGADPASISADCAYGLGWFIDFHHGCRRVSHGGYHLDFSSDVALYPDLNLGIVSFTNFGCPIPSRLFSEHLFAHLVGAKPAGDLAALLARYEERISANLERIAAIPRASGTRPSHDLAAYSGIYRHPAYGSIEVDVENGNLHLRRGQLSLPCEHWHFDSWLAVAKDRYRINISHPFDAASRFRFETDEDGQVAALHVRLEPAVEPICFTRAEAREASVS